MSHLRELPAQTTSRVMVNGTDLLDDKDGLIRRILLNHTNTFPPRDLTYLQELSPDKFTRVYRATLEGLEKGINEFMDEEDARTGRNETEAREIMNYEISRFVHEAKLRQPIESALENDSLIVRDITGNRPELVRIWTTEISGAVDEEYRAHVSKISRQPLSSLPAISK